MKNTYPDQWKDTGLALILILLLMTGFTGDTIYLVPAIIATLLTMSWPKIFYPLSILWFGFAHVLGAIVSRIVLTIIFFVIVVPAGLFRRLLGHDPMEFNKWKDDNESAFVKRDHLYSADDLDKPF